MADKLLPLPSCVETELWEYYAREVLQFINASRYGILERVDKPDLQNEYLDIGVEVTQAISPERQETENLYAWLPYITDDEKKEKRIKQIEKRGGEVKNGFLAGPKLTNDCSRVCRAFYNKLERINAGGYRLFGRNDLFIRAEFFADQTMLEEALECFCLAQNDVHCRFSQVVISSPGHNYIFDLEKKEVSDLIFPSDSQHELACNARSLVEGNLKGKGALR